MSWINNLKWSMRKDSAKEYECIKCEGMPSLVGMYCTSKPVESINSIFTGVDEGYRTIKPLRISPIDANMEFFIYTETLKIKVKRIH
jgi:hypothetical protein